MNTFVARILLVLLLGLLIPARAQSYIIDWFTVDGGGGTSSGGVYSISGTVGQPDAGCMSGGSYTLSGGFWGPLASVSVPRPSLRIERVVLGSGVGNVRVAWPYPSTGWQLQESSGLSPGVWSDVTTVPVVVGSEYQVIIPPLAATRLYRLRQL